MGITKFDKVFDFIGEFGQFQIRCLFGLSLIAFLNLEVIWMNFTGYKQDHWCHIPELEDLSDEQQRTLGIPGESALATERRYSRCFYFDLNYTAIQLDPLNHERSEDNPVKPCTSWVYDTTFFQRTIISEFDLVCGRAWLVDFITCITIFGGFLGAVPAGKLADKFGRRKALIMVVMVKIAGNVISSGIPNLVVYILGRVLAGLGSAASYQIALVLLTEHIGPEFRNVTGIGYSMFYSLGFMALPAVAYFVRDYIFFQLIWTIPMLLILIPIILIPESPRWLWVQGREDECYQNLLYIAEINGRKLPSQQDLFTSPAHQVTPEKSGSVLDLMRTPKLRCRSLILSFDWLTVSLIFFALSLSAGNLLGDLFLNTFFLGLVEIPANLLCMYGINTILLGRRYTHVAGFSVAGFAALLTVPFLMTEGYDDMRTILSLLSKGAATSVFNGIYLYTSELYPTQVRNTGLGWCNIWACVGAMAAPYAGDLLVNVWSPLPSLLIGILSGIAALITIRLDETLGKPLPETVGEVENDTDSFREANSCIVLSSVMEENVLYGTMEESLVVKEDQSKPLLGRKERHKTSQR